MSCNHLQECIKPDTSLSLINWICFTNAHHNGHRTHEETVKAFTGTVLGEHIDFEKLTILNQPVKEPVMPKPCINRIEERTVTIAFKDNEISELFNFLDAHKNECPDLHEKVYQAMTKTLFSRIDRG
jgi:hypothetical protein